jgi:hypothetical protein
MVAMLLAVVSATMMATRSRLLWLPVSISFFFFFFFFKEFGVGHTGNNPPPDEAAEDVQGSARGVTGPTKRFRRRNTPCPQP